MAKRSKEIQKSKESTRVRIDDVGSILKLRIGFPFGESSPEPQNLLFWNLSLFLKFRLKSPNLVDFWSWKCLFYWVRRKRFRLILQTRDFQLKIRDLQKIGEFDAQRGSILNFRIGSVSSIKGLIAATLSAATVSDSQTTSETLLGSLGILQQEMNQVCKHPAFCV